MLQIVTVTIQVVTKEEEDTTGHTQDTTARSHSPSNLHNTLASYIKHHAIGLASLLKKQRLLVHLTLQHTLHDAER